jgi:hypothetical protein
LRVSEAEKKKKKKRPRNGRASKYTVVDVGVPFGEL